MTHTPAVTRAFRPGRALGGLVLGLIGHVLTFGAGIVAARVREPSPGGGFEDLAAAVGVLLLGQIILALVCVIGGIVLIVRGHRDRGLGLVAGWLLGGIAGWVWIQL